MFELTFSPRRTGFVWVGGLHLILVGDHLSDADMEPGTNVTMSVKEPRMVKELDIISAYESSRDIRYHTLLFYEMLRCCTFTNRIDSTCIRGHTVIHG